MDERDDEDGLRQTADAPSLKARWPLPEESGTAAPRSPSDLPLLFEEDKGEEEQEAQPDLVTLRTEYATLSQQLEQLDVHKQAGQWARLYKQVKAAEARFRQAEQETPPSQTSPPEYAMQRAALASSEGAALLPAEATAADERQAQLRSIASDLLSWKGGLKVLWQAQLPKWRGSFKWQIEAKIEAVQAEYARLRTESTREGG